MIDDEHRQVLDCAVELATGGAVFRPRAAQLDLSCRVLAAMEQTGQCAVEAPTGTGKTLAYLASAALRAARCDERTVISTESLSLQQQIADKDAPVITEAVESVTGQSVSVAVYKGWQNTACAMSAVRVLQALLDDFHAPVPVTRDGLLDLADAAEEAVSGMPTRTRITVDGQLTDPRDALGPAAWALRASATVGPADRPSYPHPITERQWQSVSVSATDCLRNRCPLLEFCRPLAAKQRASTADLVVTNHTLLGIQAAKKVPVVLSSRSLGRFHHIVVDEAHGLPDAVRKQGESTMSGRRLLNLVRDVEQGVDQWSDGSGKLDSDTAVALKARLGGAGALASRLDVALTAAAGTAKEQVRLGDGVSPFGDAADDLVAFTTGVGGVIRALGLPEDGDTDRQRLHLRLVNRLSAFRSAVDAVSTHRTGVARWLEQQEDRSWVVKASPAQVADALRHQVWVTEPVDRADQLAQQNRGTVDFDPDPADISASTGAADVAGSRVVEPLSVCLVSATLPVGFAREVGVSARPAVLKSPLLAAFGASAVHVPTLTDTDLPALTERGPGGRVRLNTAEHPQWAARRITELVDANGGSALILVATARTGRLYADALRLAAKGRWRVMSQWDGRPAGATATLWREDHSAVLVGTRSFMTGLDAPGLTCTLVVLDRIPRAPQNPLGQARVEQLEADGLNRWQADRRVYAGDAAVLTHQAVGRLIRRETDIGMVAVLDPRLLKNKPWSYPEATRKLYAEALGDFGFRTSRHDRAVEWLRELRAARAPKAG
ncbi:ATP-dependent DNA helicase [Nakamurella multipartita]|uniref:Helicase c2 n=1 Tax=Nakamurella multipartita (strain ATCC 700099 / DSM 44233 / CIP 104796 / JCM 9543 / NBRC 105858 / Y-104) TaxID=479431 RepID=C8X8L4_NAKMY|nr:helicase C-terminal domain-containing protein [Nakamurella multipartita]ACV79069.1 helicase c2 [Nakamurella multipartita DSM 44233]